MSSVVPLVLGCKQVPDDMDSSLLSRPALIQALHEAAQQKICLIHAPTGSGKTVLISQYFHAFKDKQDLAWMALDRRDNDPAHFFSHLCHAIRYRDPEFTGYTTLQHHGTDFQLQARMASSNLLAALHRRNRPLYIIIDNFELLAEGNWIDTLALLIELTPPQVRWILSGRNTSGIDPLQWQMLDSFSLLNQAQLFFSFEETTRLLQSSSPSALDHAQIQTLFQHTRGWPAALTLVQIYLHYQPDRNIDLSVFCGRNLFNDLFNKMLDVLPAELRHFLINVSFLEELPAALCQHLLNSNTYINKLLKIKQLNLLIESDVEAGCFHLHGLLREPLLLLFQQQPAPIRDRFIANACHWLVQHGQRDQACRVARQHSQSSVFIDLLQTSIREWFRSGEAEPVYYWSQQVDESTLMALPETRFAWIWALTMFGELETALHVINKSLPAPQDKDQLDPSWTQLFRTAPNNQTTGIAILFAVIKLQRGEMCAQLLDHLQRLYNLPTLTSGHRASIDNILAHHALRQCHFRVARQRGTQAVHLMGKSGNRFGYALSHYLIANSYYQNNDIRKAQDTCTEYLNDHRMAAGRDARALIEGFSIYLEYQGHKPLLAEHKIHRLMVESQPGYSVDLQMFLMTPLLRMKSRRGEYLEAHFLLQQLEQSAHSSGSRLLQAHVEHERIRLAYAARHRQEITHMEQTFQVSMNAVKALQPDCEMPWEIRDRHVLSGVLVLLQRGETLRAQQWMQQLQFLNVDHGYPIRFLPICMCLAFIDHLMGNVSMAFRRLNDTLTQASATGMLTGLFDDIPGMDDFVRLALHQKRILNPQHVAILQDSGLLHAPSIPVEMHRSPSIERRLLECIDRGGDVEWLADQLNLSAEGLRWHMENIAWKRDQGAPL